MANEAVIIELLGNRGNVLRYTVDNTIAVPKGTLMHIQDGRICLASAADNDMFAGIAAHEKVANDGSTTLGCYTCGIFDLTDAGAGFAVGNRCSLGGANIVSVCVAGADDLFSDVGIALETAGAAEVIAVLVGGGS